MENQDGMIQEYSALRTELLKLVELRSKNIDLSIILISAMFSLASIDSINILVLLIYPLLNTVLAINWTHNDLRIHQIGEYQKKQIEPILKGINWETHIWNSYKDKSFQIKSLRQFGAVGIFLLLDFLTLLVFTSVVISKYDEIVTNWKELPFLILLLIFDVISMIYTWNLTKERTKAILAIEKENDQ